MIVIENNVNNPLMQVEKNLYRINSLPEEMLLHIFSYLHEVTDLGRLFLVNKKWNRLAWDLCWYKNKLLIDSKIAFGNNEWVQYLGKDAVKNEDNLEELLSLPYNITKMLESPCPFFPGKQIKDTHMLVRLPKSLNGELTLKNIGELVKPYFTDSGTPYRYVCRDSIAKLQDRKINKSRWVLLLKGALPGSLNKTYEEQKKMVAAIVEKTKMNYQIPDVLELTVCIFVHYMVSKTFLFPATCSRCQEEIEGYQIGVGAFKTNGLFISKFHNIALDYMGVSVSLCLTPYSIYDVLIHD